MPTFAYEGKTSSGETRKGKIDAANMDAAKNQLRKMNISPTSISKSMGSMDIQLFKPKVTTKDLVIFTRQFATMIDSGLPLVQCLDIQSKQAQNPTFREELSVVKEAVESGSTFADALKKYPATFDDLLVTMLEDQSRIDRTLQHNQKFLLRKANNSYSRHSGRIQKWPRR